jgi:hypothetical protein
MSARPWRCFLYRRRTAESGWADERQIVVSVDPFALGRILEWGAVKTAGISIIDVFGAGLPAQFRDAQPEEADRRRMVASKTD